jgi:hypothetical protein
VLVGPDGRLGEMPRLAFGLLYPQLGQLRVGPATLVMGRQLRHRRADQRVPKRQPAGALIEVYQLRLLGRG